MTIALISLLDFESFPIRQFHPFLEREGFNVKSIFLKANGYKFPSKKEVEILIDYLKTIKPSLIGISLRSRYFKLAKSITKIIKENFKVPIVWGGIHPTIAPNDCIKYTDIVCIGEGEYAIKELAKKIERKEDYTKIKNLWVKKGKKIFKNPIRPLIENLDSLPFTDFSDKNKVYIENEKLVHNIKNVKSSRIEFKFCYPIMTSRGCLFNCTYCVNSFLRNLYKGKGKYTRRRSVKNVIEELKLAKKNLENLNSIIFGDDVFSFDYKWLKSFAIEYKKQINLPFFTMFNPSMIEEKSVKLLKEMGLVNVQMGIQSGSERIRKEYYHRFNSDEQIRNGMKIFKKYKLSVSCDLILGDVFENKLDRKKTLNLLLSLPKPYYLHCFYMNYFPNYLLTNRALKEGFISEERIVNNLPYEKQSFGKQFDNNRPKKYLFWESIYKLASFKYVPLILIKQLSKSNYLQKKPWCLITLVKIIIKIRYLNRIRRYIFKHLSNPKVIYSKIKQKLIRKQSLS